MVKKVKAKSAKISSKAQKGDKYTCDACGMIITVDNDCSCEPCGITCCDQDMRLLAGC